jgi:hypothetical protein
LEKLSRHWQKQAATNTVIFKGDLQVYTPATSKFEKVEISLTVCLYETGGSHSGSATRSRVL